MSESDIRQGHPRTMEMHQDWQMRSVAKAQNQNAPTIDRNALRSSTVVRARKNGDVQIEAFTNLVTGQGSWFTPFNFSPCREGDTVLYTYVDEVPIVLGRMPDVTIPFIIPNQAMQDTLFFEEFDHGSNVSGTFGLYRWLSQVVGGGTVGQGAFGPNNPGTMILTSGTAIGNYATIFPPGSCGQLAEGLDSVGWMLFLNTGFSGGASAICQAFPGIVDNAGAPANYIGFTSNSVNWLFVMSNNAPAGSAAIDTGIPVVDGHWYAFMIKRIAPGSWAGYVWDRADRIDSVSILNNANTTVQMWPFVRNYPLFASTARVLYVDYVWWARRGVLR